MISGSLITIPVLFFGGVILSLRKDVMMSLILLLFVPAIFLIVRPISKRIGPLHETSDKYIDIQNDVMRERLHGIRVSAHLIRKQAYSRRSPTRRTSWPRTSSTPTCRWAF